MIDAVTGTLVGKEEDVAFVEVQGIRFRVEIPASTSAELPAPGGQVTLRTRLSFNSNDGEFLLFGFGTLAERECFEIFTSIPGIGPRKGLMILSQIEIAAFSRAIIANDLGYLSRIKGVGKKTAERMVVELREKMVPYTGPVGDGAKGTPLPQTDEVHDAVEAMIVLGVKPAVAEKAIAKAIEELGRGAGIEALIRAGLRNR